MRWLGASSLRDATAHAELTKDQVRKTIKAISAASIRLLRDHPAAGTRIARSS